MTNPIELFFDTFADLLGFGQYDAATFVERARRQLILRERVTGIVKAAAAAAIGRSKVVSESGTVANIIRYGAMVQQMQNQICYLHLTPSFDSLLGGFSAIPGDKNSPAAMVYWMPFKPAIAGKSLFAEFNDNPTGKRAFDFRPQSWFRSQAAPVHQMTSAGYLINTPEFLAFPGNSQTDIDTRNNWPKTQLFDEPFLRFGGVMSPGIDVYRRLPILAKAWNPCFTGLFDNIHSADLNALSQCAARPLVIPAGFEGGVTAYAARVQRWAHYSRWMVWAVEEARVNAGAPQNINWKRRCHSWGVGYHENYRLDRLYPLDSFAAWNPRNEKGNDKIFDAIRGTGSGAWFPEKEIRGTLKISVSEVNRWIDFVLATIPPVWTLDPIRVNNRLITDYPAGLESMAPPCYIRQADIVALNTFIADYKKAKNRSIEDSKHAVRVFARLLAKVVIAVVSTAVTMGGASVPAGALIAQEAAQIAAAAKQAIAGGVEVFKVMVGELIKKFGPALAMRFANRALQAAGLNVDLPALADNISQGLPALGQNTIEGTVAKLKSEVSYISGQGWTHIEDVAGGLITENTYVPEIPGVPDFNFRALFKV